MQVGKRRPLGGGGRGGETLNGEVAKLPHTRETFFCITREINQKHLWHYIKRLFLKKNRQCSHASNHPSTSAPPPLPKKSHWPAKNSINQTPSGPINHHASLTFSSNLESRLAKNTWSWERVCTSVPKAVLFPDSDRWLDVTERRHAVALLCSLPSFSSPLPRHTHTNTARPSPRQVLVLSFWPPPFHHSLHTFHAVSNSLQASIVAAAESMNSTRGHLLCYAV